MQLAEIGEEKATKIIESALDLVKKKEEAGEEAEQAEVPAASDAAAPEESSETAEEVAGEKSTDEQG
jgi:hypothetical protein